MVKNKLPRIGVLGIMQELYIPIYPDIKERQEKYTKKVLSRLCDIAEFDFPEAAFNRESIERIIHSFNDGHHDGVMIIMLTYGASFLDYNAFRMNRLPILLTNIQPEQVITQDWGMAELTYNQGIHGAQDTANALMWTNSKFTVWTGNWRDDSFKKHVSDWADAAGTYSRLSEIKISQIGQMIGMGDIQINPAKILSQLGIQVDQTGIGLIYKEMERASEAEIKQVLMENQDNFEIDKNLSMETHRYAALFQVGLERFLEKNNYSGVSVYFNAPADDGRFRQLPLMAASNLMAKGYGYGGEGDVASTILVTIGQVLKENASFIEMYAMDFDRDSILLSHMGEGNWKIARKDRKIKLVNRPLGIGGLENPPTTVFSAEPGPATLVTLITRTDGELRLILSKGEILDTGEMPNVEMPYYHYKPDTGVVACQNGWLKWGGSHHQCIHTGDLETRWQLFCDMAGIEFIRV